MSNSEVAVAVIYPPLVHLEHNVQRWDITCSIMPIITELYKSTIYTSCSVDMIHAQLLTSLCNSQRGNMIHEKLTIIAVEPCLYLLHGVYFAFMDSEYLFIKIWCLHFLYLHLILLFIATAAPQVFPGRIIPSYLFLSYVVCSFELFHYSGSFRQWSVSTCHLV